LAVAWGSGNKSHAKADAGFCRIRMGVTISTMHRSTRPVQPPIKRKLTVEDPWVCQLATCLRNSQTLTSATVHHWVLEKTQLASVWPAIAARFTTALQERVNHCQEKSCRRIRGTHNAESLAITLKQAIWRRFRVKITGGWTLQLAQVELSLRKLYWQYCPCCCQKQVVVLPFGVSGFGF
jgi:hypothetical protein